MSIKVMTLVWDKSPASGSELLALLALADWCNDEGGSLHPSIVGLARKIRVSESQARRILHGLIDAGYLSVIGNLSGGAPGQTRRYQLHIEKLRALPEIEETASMDARGSTGARGSMDARDGSHGCAETASMDDTRTVSITTIEPSIVAAGAAAPVSPKNRKSPITMKTWLDQCEQNHEAPIAEDDPLFADSQKTHLPVDFILLAWYEFRDIHKFGERQSNKQADWRATFRNCVRSNWYKLWALNADGAFFLTTQGKMALRRHEQEMAA